MQPLKLGLIFKTLNFLVILSVIFFACGTDIPTELEEALKNSKNNSEEPPNDDPVDTPGPNDPGSVTWQETDMGAALNTQKKIALGDGRNQNSNHVYTGDDESSDGNIYEFNFINGQWENSIFGTFQNSTGNQNLIHIYGLTVGERRNDGVSRIYASGYGVAEFEYASDNFNGDRIDTGLQWTRWLIIGNARNDGNNRAYVADWNGIYELTFTGGGWIQELIDTGNTNIVSLVICDGRNDGVQRLYACAYMGQEVYEFTWSNDQWEAKLCLKLEIHTSILEIHAADGRNDGRNRLYVISRTNIYELSYIDSGWQSEQVAESDRVLTMAVGPGRNDGNQYLYVSEYQTTLREYAYVDGWRPTSVLVSDRQINGIAVGDGRGNRAACVYATAENNHVYEFCAP
jgi:hypothetical protein